MQETEEMRVRSLDQEDSLEKEIGTHSSILAWRIPRTEEPGGSQKGQSQQSTRRIMYLKLRRETILCVLTTYTKSKLCEMTDRLISLIAVIISQWIIM